MSVVISGHARYGRVRAHGGEHAETEFAHLSYVPLFPIGSYWVTGEAGGGAHFGFPIKLHWRSVLATYLRTWVAALAALVFLAPSIVTTAIALALAALSAWSWTWRSRRGARALQRSDFDRVALGNRCDPAWLTDDVREHLSRTLGARLAERDDARPPDDVARFGARDRDEAIVAYGILRVSGVDHADARAAADRLLANTFDAAGAPGGPYREGGAGTSGFGAEIAAAAQAHAAATLARRRQRPSPWFQDPWLHLVALVGVTGLACFQIYTRVSQRLVDARALGSLHPPVGERVIVRCDRVEDRGWEVLQGRKVKQRVTFCWLGDHLLPVVSDAHDSPDKGDDDLTLEGKLHDLPAFTSPGAPWAAELHADLALEVRAYEVFLRREGVITGRFLVMTAAVTTVAAAVGWLLWLQAFRRRRRRAA